MCFGNVLTLKNDQIKANIKYKLDRKPLHVSCLVLCGVQWWVMCYVACNGVACLVADHLMCHVVCHVIYHVVSRGVSWDHTLSKMKMCVM